MRETKESRVLRSYLFSKEKSNNNNKYKKVRKGKISGEGREIG